MQTQTHKSRCECAKAEQDQLVEKLQKVGIYTLNYPGQQNRLNVLKSFNFSGSLTPIYQRLLQNMIQETLTPKRQLMRILRRQDTFYKLDNVYKLIKTGNLTQLNQQIQNNPNYNFITPTQQYIINELIKVGYKNVLTHQQSQLLTELIQKMYLKPLELPRVRALYDKIVSIVEFPDQDEVETGVSTRLISILTKLKTQFGVVSGTSLTRTQEKALLSEILTDFKIYSDQFGYESIVAEGYVPGTPMTQSQALRYISLSGICCQESGAKESEEVQNGVSPGVERIIPLVPRTMSIVTPLIALMSPVTIYEE